MALWIVQLRTPGVTPGWGGFSHGGTILRNIGIYCSNGSFFHKTSLLKHGSHKHGFAFPKFPKFSGVCHVNTWKLWKMGPYFRKKSLKMGTFYCQNDPQKWVGISKVEWHTQSEPNLNNPGRPWVPQLKAQAPRDTNKKAHNQELHLLHQIFCAAKT